MSPEEFLKKVLAVDESNPTTAEDYANDIIAVVSEYRKHAAQPLRAVGGGDAGEIEGDGE